MGAQFALFHYNFIVYPPSLSVCLSASPSLLSHPHFAPPFTSQKISLHPVAKRTLLSYLPFVRTFVKLFVRKYSEENEDFRFITNIRFWAEYSLFAEYSAILTNIWP